MPDREQIITRLRQLPSIPAGTIALDHQIWEQDEAGAHFKVTREHHQDLQTGLRLTFYSLSVSGLMSGKEQVISDFLAVLGQPLLPIQDLAYPGVHFALWNANRVNRELFGS